MWQFLSGVQEYWFLGTGFCYIKLTPWNNGRKQSCTLKHKFLMQIVFVFLKYLDVHYVTIYIFIYITINFSVS